MPSYKLTYFDIDSGRAEPVRIAFHAAGVDFEDDRIAFQDFARLRENYRFTCLPVLEIDDIVVTQSNSLARYVGKMAGLYPADDLQALFCDEAMAGVEDLLQRIVPTFGLDGDALRLAREQLVDGWITVYLRGLGELLERGGGNYFADHRLTVADLKVFVQTRSLQAGVLDHVPADIVTHVAPILADHQDRIAAESVVVDYYAARAA